MNLIKKFLIATAILATFGSTLSAQSSDRNQQQSAYRVISQEDTLSQRVRPAPATPQGEAITNEFYKGQSPRPRNELQGSHLRQRSTNGTPSVVGQVGSGSKQRATAVRKTELEMTGSAFKSPNPSAGSTSSFDALEEFAKDRSVQDPTHLDEYGFPRNTKESSVAPQYPSDSATVSGRNSFEALEKMAEDRPVPDPLTLDEYGFPLKGTQGSAMKPARSNVYKPQGSGTQGSSTKTTHHSAPEAKENPFVHQGAHVEQFEQFEQKTGGNNLQGSSTKTAQPNTSEVTENPFVYQEAVQEKSSMATGAEVLRQKTQTKATDRTMVKPVINSAKDTSAKAAIAAPCCDSAKNHQCDFWPACNEPEKGSRWLVELPTSAAVAAVMLDLLETVWRRRWWEKRGEYNSVKSAKISACGQAEPINIDIASNFTRFGL